MAKFTHAQIMDDPLQVDKNKRHRRKTGRISRVILWFLLLLPVCLISMFCILPFALPEIGGQLILSSTRYFNADVQYSGYRVVGSGEWQDKTFILWTEDSIESVRQHYSTYFDEVEPSREYDSMQYFFRRIYLDIADAQGFRLIKLCVSVRLVEASAENRSTLLLDSYDGDPYSILENLPTYGTIIIFNHNIFAP